MTLGAAGRPREESEKIVERKFARESAGAIGEDNALRAASIVGRLETATPGEVGDLMACLRGGG